MRKLLILAAAALYFAAGPVLADDAAKHDDAKHDTAKHDDHKMMKKHHSKAHHCVDEKGTEVKTDKGETIRRHKTCDKFKGKWEMKEGGEHAAAGDHKADADHKDMDHKADADHHADAPADKK